MMQRKLSSLACSEFDLIVVGGGIFGACAAWDATQRGLSVALIERGDFCSATSANSFKMIHGGIRYLQHGDLYRVRQSANARRAMIRIAPHLVSPLGIVVPTYGHGMKGKEILSLAMGIYDVLTFDRNYGISDFRRHIQRGRCLSKEEMLERFPGIETRGLTGGGIFCDGQMYNPPRLVLAFLQTAEAAGAIISNYVEATKFILAGNRVRGVDARDVLTGETFPIRGKIVLNAAGPHAESLLERALGRRLQPRTLWSRDAYFVVPRRLLKGREALALPSLTKDPEALLSRGNRHLFLTPWHGYTLVGVWHKVYDGHPDGYDVTEEELEAFCKEVNAGYPSLRLSRSDISLCNAGLIPFGENDPNAKDLKFGHRSRLVDHTRLDHLEGLVTLVGIRYTTGQCEAAKAVDLIFRKLGKDAPPSRSHMTPLLGGDFTDFESLVRAAFAELRGEAKMETVRALVHNYGSGYRRVLSYVNGRSVKAQTIGSSTVLDAEVVCAAREEMAQTLADVVFRRTDLGTGEYPGSQALETCAELMSFELHWDEDRKKQEIENVTARFPATGRPQEKAADWEHGQIQTVKP